MLLDCDIDSSLCTSFSHSRFRRSNLLNRCRYLLCEETVAPVFDVVRAHQGAKDVLRAKID